jgi:ribosomal protein S18 acetylase RimI-like enzyme
MHFKLTQVTHSDLDKVLGLFKAAAEKIAKKEIDHWQYWKNPPPERVKWVEEGIQNREFFFIESTEHKTIGMVRILKEDKMYWGENNDKAIYVHSLVVAEEYEGKGIGNKVLTKIQNDAQRDCYEYLRLDCVSNNKKLCEYYEKQGFVKVGQKTFSLSTNNLYQKKITSK